MAKDRVYATEAYVDAEVGGVPAPTVSGALTAFTETTNSAALNDFNLGNLITNIFTTSPSDRVQNVSVSLKFIASPYTTEHHVILNLTACAHMLTYDGSLYTVHGTNSTGFINFKDADSDLTVASGSGITFKMSSFSSNVRLLITCPLNSRYYVNVFTTTP